MSEHGRGQPWVQLLHDLVAALPGLVSTALSIVRRLVGRRVRRG